MLNRFIISLLMLAICGAVLPSNAAAQDMSEPAIKKRALDRVKAIDGLKASGSIGENKAGFIEARGSVSKQSETLIKSENEDRTALYAIIAKRLGLNAKVVGESRADELRKKSAKGVWVQSKSGKWYKK
ncbi:MAG: DUF1318 domain-containing protein [Verrucomicrobiota bacterium]